MSLQEEASPIRPTRGSLAREVRAEWGCLTPSHPETRQQAWPQRSWGRWVGAVVRVSTRYTAPGLGLASVPTPRPQPPPATLRPPLSPPPARRARPHVGTALVYFRLSLVLSTIQRLNFKQKKKKKKSSGMGGQLHPATSGRPRHPASGNMGPAQHKLGGQGVSWDSALQWAWWASAPVPGPGGQAW